MDATYDIVIMGGALAGASMGLLLRRSLPEARVLIVERSVEYDFKVGESTSEVAGCFLTRVLRIGSWLSREQIAKNGLRFWFTKEGNTCIKQCAELGPKFQSRLPAWQLDRSRLDTHVLSLAEQQGCEVWRPATVREWEQPGGGENVLTIVKDGESKTVRAKWIVDATGKAAFIARKRGTLRTLEAHPTSSMWARFRNVGDLDAVELADAKDCCPMRVWTQRATATNHLAGWGWWAWIIPLQGGETSVGITWDRRLYTPPAEGSIVDRLMAALSEHPVGRYFMQHAEAVENDARVYSQLAYYSTEVIGPGWVAVGDAAGFMDPLYSHGIDYIGSTVCSVHAILVEALRGTDVSNRVNWYRQHYQESYHRWFEALYKDKYHYLGDAELMYASVLMDVGCYFIGPVRLVYSNQEREFALLPYNGRIGAWFGKFMRFYNRRLVKIACERREMGTYGRANDRQKFIVKDGFQPSFAVQKLIRRGVWAWLKIECGHRFARLRRRKQVPAGGDAVPVMESAVKAE